MYSAPAQANAAPMGDASCLARPAAAADSRALHGRPNAVIVVLAGMQRAKLSQPNPLC